MTTDGLPSGLPGWLIAGRSAEHWPQAGFKLEDNVCLRVCSLVQVLSSSRSGLGDALWDFDQRLFGSWCKRQQRSGSMSLATNFGYVLPGACLQTFGPHDARACFQGSQKPSNSMQWASAGLCWSLLWRRLADLWDAIGWLERLRLRLCSKHLAWPSHIPRCQTYPGLSLLCWPATPCSSFTVMCRHQSARLPENGYLGPEDPYQFVKDGNSLMECSALVYFVCYLLSIHVTLEQPTTSVMSLCASLKGVLHQCREVQGVHGSLQWAYSETTRTVVDLPMHRWLGNRPSRHAWGWKPGASLSVWVHWTQGWIFCSRAKHIHRNLAELLLRFVRENGLEPDLNLVWVLSVCVRSAKRAVLSHTRVWDEKGNCSKCTCHFQWRASKVLEFKPLHSLALILFKMSLVLLRWCLDFGLTQIQRMLSSFSLCCGQLLDTTDTTLCTMCPRPIKTRSFVTHRKFTVNPPVSEWVNHIHVHYHWDILL